MTKLSFPGLFLVSFGSELSVDRSCQCGHWQLPKWPGNPHYSPTNILQIAQVTVLCTLKEVLIIVAVMQ